MTIILNGKTYEVANEKEAKKLANGRTYTVKEGVSYRVVINDVDLETMVKESGRVKDNKK